MEQTPMSIYDFLKGDKITRMVPSKPIKIFGEETVEDRQYIGEPLIFLGVANGCVYVEREEKPQQKRGGGMMIDGQEGPLGFLKMLFGGPGPINLPLDVWDEGWGHYINPYEIGDQTESKYDILDDSSLEVLRKQLDIALRKEEYEKADRIKIKITKIKKGEK